MLLRGENQIHSFWERKQQRIPDYEVTPLIYLFIFSPAQQSFPGHNPIGSIKKLCTLLCTLHYLGILSLMICEFCFRISYCSTDRCAQVHDPILIRVLMLTIKDGKSKLWFCSSIDLRAYSPLVNVLTLYHSQIFEPNCLISKSYFDLQQAKDGGVIRNFHSVIVCIFMSTCIVQKVKRTGALTYCIVCTPSLPVSQLPGVQIM